LALHSLNHFVKLRYVIFIIKVLLYCIALNLSFSDVAYILNDITGHSSAMGLQSEYSGR